MQEVVLFGGGSFWCLEPAFSALRGVIEVWPGYAGGTMQYPTRRLVDSGITGHVEVVQVIYSPNEISFEVLIDAFFTAHNFSLENGAHRKLPGLQHASVIFYSTSEQEKIARHAIAHRKKKSKKPVRTELHQMTEFWAADTQDISYYFFNGFRDSYCEKEIRPILRRFAREYWHQLKLPERVRHNNPFL